MNFFLTFFYNCIFLLLIIVYIPGLFLKGKYHKGVWERFRCALPESTKGKNVIWFHAVSVGEVLAIVDLLKKLRKVLPEYTFVLSVVTQTGHDIARTQLKNLCLIIYAPLDLSWIVRQFIKVINPCLYVATETEIWPNLYGALFKSKVPIIQVNGRISDQSFKGYKSVLFLTRSILSCVSCFCVQSEQDATRLKILGADPQKIVVAGNVKFDNLLSVGSGQYDVGEGRLLVAGSTHSGEEEIVLNIYQRLRCEFSDLRLVIAPRHVERVESVMKLIKEKSLKVIKFSKMSGKKFKDDVVVVVDKIGVLRNLYPLANLVFIGKSFKVGGGQNMIEPVACGKPTFVGPYTQNFKDVMNIFLSENIIFQVADEKELFRKMRNVLGNFQDYQQLANKAKAVIRKHQGATERTIKCITKLL
ncbi:3-deoxy-D-manno-octulosonic acid transferase [hydrothermal vent metagenome]|uniref:3-deoxy-D-manno-octulosonic acid transferase n=1 Tax=hydrothermal vent metagenome TaxID=652676 RepID=A0A3B1DTE7_9ZZZZ